MGQVPSGCQSLRVPAASSEELLLCPSSRTSAHTMKLGLHQRTTLQQLFKLKTTRHLKLQSESKQSISIVLGLCDFSGYMKSVTLTVPNGETSITLFLCFFVAHQDKIICRYCITFKKKYILKKCK